MIELTIHFITENTNATIKKQNNAEVINRIDRQRMKVACTVVKRRIGEDF